MTKDEIISASQSNRSSAFLYREALQNEWIDFSLNVRNSGQWYVPILSKDTAEYSKSDHETQLRAYLCESLATALDHPDPIIAFRAYGQATAYAGRLVGMGTTPGSRHCDALLEARNRLETIIQALTNLKDFAIERCRQLEESNDCFMRSSELANAETDAATKELQQLKAQQCPTSAT